MPTAWIRQPEKNPQSKLNLFCIPHAGGNASLYRHWTTLLSKSIHPLIVCLPGREHRINDPMPDNMAELVEQISCAIEPFIDDHPWAIFGHSMGATLAHEVSANLVNKGYQAPVHLFLSARKPSQHHCGGTVHLKSDQDLCEEMIRLGGTPAELFEMPEIRDLFLPSIRADYKILETWDGQSSATINAPLTVFRGIDDTELTLQQAQGWQEWHTGKFDIKSFPGGHFYLSEDPTSVINEIHKILLN